jgi:hypothetical protein
MWDIMHGVSELTYIVVHKEKEAAIIILKY